MSDRRRHLTLADIAASLDLTGQRFLEFARVQAQKPLGPDELDELGNWAFRLAFAVRQCQGEIAGALAPAPDNVIPIRNERPAMNSGAVPSPIDAADGVEGGAS